MKKALIISPTGTNMYFDDAYDKSDHWRYTKPERTYETCLVVFNDFEPEPGTYDYMIRRPGLKWNLIPEVCKIIKWEDYDYIGCFDDDYVTDIKSLNEALDIARKFDFRLFQQSLISETGYECLVQNKDYFFSETNFIELGVPFFRNDIFRKVLRLLNDYRYQKSDWGIDKILCAYLQASAHVVHCNSVKHMRKESSYSKDDGFREMHYIIHDFFPKYMKEKFNLTYVPTDVQKTINAYALENKS